MERVKPPRVAWLPAAAVLLGTGWGANQFAPMLLVYRGTLDLGTGTLVAMFGLYALGLIPALLLAGPISDARGRRAVVIPAGGLSLVATLVLVAGADSAPLLFLGRLLAGVSSGAVFGAGTAWLREASQSEPAPAVDPQAAQSEPRMVADPLAARRAAIAMTAGFGLGPLVAGLLAEWAPAPGVVPYLPHIALMVVVLAMLRDAPETVVRDPARRVRLAAPGVSSRRFRRVVAPMAPWVFAAPAIGFALLPSVIGADEASAGIALTAAITGATALAGVLVQPLGRRLDAHAGGNRAATAGLLVLAAGLSLGAVTAETGHIWLLVPNGIVLGCAYGLCLVAGLVEVQRIAAPGALAGLTAVYYALTYIGFGAPYLLALGANLIAYPALFAIAAALALCTAALVTRAAAHP